MDIPKWILQERPPARATEIYVNITLEVTPVTFYADPSGEGWQGVMVAGAFGEQDCGHHHFDQDAAWACVEAMALAYQPKGLLRHTP